MSTSHSCAEFHKHQACYNVVTTLPIAFIFTTTVVTIIRTIGRILWLRGRGLGSLGFGLEDLSV